MKGPALNLGRFVNHPIPGIIARKQQPVYSTWRAMLARCYNPKHKAYPQYGGAGVTVCQEWHTFQNFARWYQENYVQGWHIDKDLYGLQEYGPKTCVFLPEPINQLLRCYTSNERAVGKSTHTWWVRAKDREDKYYTVGKFATREEAVEFYQTRLRQKMADLVIKYPIPAATAAKLLSL